MTDDRARIDAIDRALVALLAERAACVARLWHEKAAQGVPRHDAAREAAIFAAVRDEATASGVDPDAVEAVFRRIVGQPF